MKTRKQLVTIDDAKPCDSQPSNPCSDCPWARTALVGWLGGATIEEWLATAHSDSKINCHTLIGPQCAGAAIYRSNILKRPRDKTILLLPKNTVTVFANPFEFIKHHTHKKRK